MSRDGDEEGGAVQQVSPGGAPLPRRKAFAPRRRSHAWSRLLLALSSVAVLLIGVALICALSLSAPALAQAVGGNGGNTAIGGAGGNGGTSTSPNGGNGTDSTLGGGGGGGGGVSLTTGLGGTGGTGGSNSGEPDTSAGGAGGNGGNYFLVNPSSLTGGTGSIGGDGASAAAAVEDGGGGGGGGAGGGGALFTGSNVTAPNGATIGGGSGGTGGNGGNGDEDGGSGGAGGAGGDGIDFAGRASLTNTGSISGGNGGAGGNGGNGGAEIGGNGGSGGAGGVGIDFAGSASLTNTGSISGGNGGAGGAAGTGVFPGSAGSAGAGGVGVTGAGLTIINSGSIAGGLSGSGVQADAILFTGGVNTLQLQPGYNIVGNVVGTGNDAFQLGGSGSSNFNLSNFGSTQQYQGFATFSVVGGNWTLTGANSTAVPFSVSNATATVNGTFDDTSATVNAGGILVVNGTLSDPTIYSGGTLTGTGAVGPTQINGGTFAPGNGTPGSYMTVNGNLAFTSGALYVVYLNPTTASFATVTGTASLAGTVQANFASGSYIAKQYTILTANDGVSGTFSGIDNANLPAGFTDSLSYNADDAFLNLSAALGAGTPLNQNQENVATAINTYFNSGGVLPPALTNIFGLTGTALQNALTHLDGEDATGAETSAFDLMNEFLGLMLDPFVDGRSVDQNIGADPGSVFDYAPLATKAPLAPAATFNQRWTTWAAGFGGSGTSNGDPTVGSNNVTTSTYGYAAGMDYHVSPDTVLGFSLAGGGTNWNLANALGTGRSDAFLAGVYGVTHRGPWYFAGALAFANNWFTTNRAAMGDQLTANFSGQSYAARLEGGYRFALPVYHGAAGVTPYAALQAQNFQTPAYSETDLSGGGFGLSYNAMSANDTRSELGARFDDLTALNAMPLILRAKLAWAHDWVSNPALDASFESLPGSSFTVYGAPIPHDSALASAGAQLFFTPNWSLLAKFDGDFADGSQLYAGSGTLRYSW
jgi:uncharacterized protein with beta-barrel porin domain